MFFIYAIAAFGLILSQKTSITQAATEGARSALSVPGVASPTDVQRQDQAKATVASTLSWMGSKYQASDTTAVVAPCAAPNQTSSCITVTITYPYASRPLLPPAPGLGLITPNQVKSTAVLRIT